MKQTLKLKDSNSLIGWLMANNESIPEVGKGATVIVGSDRYGYEVLSVSDDLKNVTIRPYDVKRIDDNGMSDCQDYSYTPNPKAHTKELVYRNGAWRVVCECIDFVDQYYKEFEKQSKHNYRLAYDTMIQPLFDENNDLMLVEGKTRVSRSYGKINILFGQLNHYYDFSF